jgi:hypothetical protein
MIIPLVAKAQKTGDQNSTDALGMYCKSYVMSDEFVSHAWHLSDIGGFCDRNNASDNQRNHVWEVSSEGSTIT